ncbi:MAG TPA: 16S rRNA (cytosine(1402)-N(4))-methyltransferase, partial [Firmicutes bacterium]|nr:16S rRNA (cytosine(1402)-N(4))-methyltransferase [Bacillota bacterium]
MADGHEIKAMADCHVPVLLAEVLKFMNPQAGKNYIDATGGPGNMSRAILKASCETGRVLTIDCDPRAISIQQSHLDEFGERSVRKLANFSSIESVARDEGFIPSDGIIYDLGVSSMMIDNPEYGFSIQ